MQWTHRTALTGIAACLSVALALGGCGGGSDAGTAQTGSDQGIGSFESAPVSVPPTAQPTASASVVPSPSASARAPKAKPSASTPEVIAAAGTYAFPVIGNSSYAHTHHDYPATDIMTSCGNTFVAVTSGTISSVVSKDTWKRSVNAGATRGGLSVGLVGADGVRYYGSHLSKISKGIQPGVHVQVGQVLGLTGATGDAAACHLHFGISPACGQDSDWWIRRGVIFPWPYLDAWRKHRSTSPVAAIKAWHAQHGCPKKPLVDP